MVANGAQHTYDKTIKTTERGETPVLSPGKRRGWVSALLVAGICWTALSAATPLPNDRGYELVSPVDKSGGDILISSTRTHAAADGSALAFASLTGFADAIGTGVDVDYMSVRTGVDGTTGWATHALTPQQGPLSLAAVGGFGFQTAFDGDFSPDLTHAVYRAFGAFPGTPNVQRVPNLYLRTDLRNPGGGTYRLLTDSATPQLFTSSRPRLAGASADFTHVIFESPLNLTPNAAGGSSKLYESENSAVRLAGILPNGAGANASGAGIGAATNRFTPRTISADGSRIFFTDMDTGSLYARINGAVTVQLNASERTAPEAPGTATYWTASTDGTRVFFSTSEALVDEDVNGDNDLYMWARATHDEVQDVTVDATSGTFLLAFNGQITAPIASDATADSVRAALIALPNVGSGNVDVTGGPGSAGGGTPYAVRFTGAFAGTDVAELAADASALSGGGASASVVTTQPVRNLTLISRDTAGADAPVIRDVFGASDDGRYVYFAASGQLLVDAGSPDDFPSGAGIYVWHDGALRYVGWITDFFDLDRNSPLSPWGVVSQSWASRVTPDGRHLLFISHSDEGLRGQGGFAGADHGTTCSYDSDGVPGCRELYLYNADSGTLRCASCHVGTAATGDALTLHQERSGASSSTYHLSHALSDDGRYVFFATADPLVPQDVNGKLDVYEYDSATGTQHLLTSGTSPSDSYLMDASDSGRDVFFLTRDRLVGWDVDVNYDLYDARVGGGMPDPPPAADVCSGDACQASPAAAPGVLDGASRTLRGAGDATPRLRARHRPKRCRHGARRVVRRGKAKCVRKHKRPGAHSRRAK